MKIKPLIQLREMISKALSGQTDNVGKIVPLRRMKQYCCVGVNRTATSE